MLSFEPELTRLRPLLGDALTDALIARQRREIFSIYPELRVCAWAGAMLIATAAGIVVTKNFERIGPMAIAVLIGIAAAACYAWVWWRRSRASIVDDFILLLGALLVSADAGFIESQFHLLGDDWHRHFLILAIAHGAAAYAYRSRMVLSLSITALAAWLGIEQKSFASYEDPIAFATRAAICAALLLMWRFVNRVEEFAPLFEHFAAVLLVSAGLAMAAEDETLTFGCLATIVIAAIVIAWGFRTRRESFVLYAFIYAVIAIDILILFFMDDEEVLGFGLVVLSAIAAVVALIAIHARFKELRA